MTRLPIVGGDDGEWGKVLNDFLLTSHAPNGSLASESVSIASLTQEVVTLIDTKAPLSHQHDASVITSGQITPARLGQGIANSTTFLRGDGQWAIPEQQEGLTLLTGLTIPSPAQGDIGNYYLDTNQRVLYGPKTATSGAQATIQTGINHVTTFSSSTTTTVTLTKPAATTDGDLLFAVMEHRGATTVTMPSGWVSLSNSLPATYGKWYMAYLSVTEATALPNSWTWSFDAERRAAGVLFRITGADTLNPIDTFMAGVSTDPLVLPSMDVLTDNSLLIATYTSTAGTASQLSSPGMTLVGLATASGGDGSTVGVLSEQLGDAGVTGNRTLTSDVTWEQAGALIAIRSLGASPWPIAMRGIPRGGTPGQVLTKTSYSDFQLDWVDPIT